MTAVDTFLWIYEDPGRGLALLRGRNVKKVLASAVLLDRARWSESGKGWVVPISSVPDLVAMAQYEGIPCQLKMVDPLGGDAS